MTVDLVTRGTEKKLMQNFCTTYGGILSRNTLYATDTTGRLIEEAANPNIYKYLTGHLDDIQQMTTQIEHNEVDLVIFLRDPQSPESYEPGVNDMVRLYDVYNIPLVTDLASTEPLIKAPDRGDMKWREVTR